MLLKTALVVAALSAAGCNTQPPTPSAAAVEPAPLAPAPSDAARTANDTNNAAHHADSANAKVPAPQAAALTPSTAATATAEARSPAASSSPASVDPEAPRRAVREVTIPAGTTLRLQLASAVSSASSGVEDAVQATVQRPVVLDGVTVVPAGAAVSGYVTEATRSARVKGRARVGMRFNALRVGDTRYDIRTSAVTREAPGTKKEDATKIGIGAGAGAVVGAIAGGKKGAAIGTAVGAGGGTAAVLATRGDEIAIERGAVVTTRLSQPVTIRVH